MPPQVFAYGEDTRALRLASELADLRAGYVNWFSCALRIENPAQSASNDSKEKSTPDGVSPPQVFAYGEDTHALRLASELAGAIEIRDFV